MARMSGLRYPRPWLILAACVAVAALAVPGASLAASHPPRARNQRPALRYRPRTRAAAFGNLDCNGHSPIQHPIKVGGYICAEVHGGTHNGHLEDNGYYIGHDEPTVQFYSSKPGSSTNVSYVQTLPRDPSAAPTVHGPLKDTTHFFELMPTLWYAMALCDPNSYPLLPCKPDSDSNSPHGNYPGGGSAFLELQFYPPGFAPLADGLSCDNSHWCAALTIDSLECQAGFAVCNNNCVEPVNFAFVQTNGVPTGPPSPQKANLNTVTPNQRTLLMNPGDKLDDPHLRQQERGGTGNTGPRSQYRQNRVHAGLGQERLHEHLDRRLQRHAVQLPAGVLDRQHSQPGRLGSGEHQRRLRGRALHPVHQAEGLRSR